jgi:hypothetical protein
MMGHLRYSTATSLRKDGIMSVSSLVGYGSMTLVSAWIELTGTKRVSVWKILSLAIVEALRDSEQHWGCTVNLNL